MADLATKFSDIPPTIFRDFLPPEEDDTLVLNDLDEEFVFLFSYLYSFSAQISEIADYFELTVISLHRKTTFGIMLLNSQGDLTGRQNCCL